MSGACFAFSPCLAVPGIGLAWAGAVHAARESIPHVPNHAPCAAASSGAQLVNPRHIIWSTAAHPRLLKPPLCCSGDAQLVNSVYLDNSSLELYHARLDKRPGALAIRVRWNGPGDPNKVGAGVGVGWGTAGVALSCMLLAPPGSNGTMLVLLPCWLCLFAIGPRWMWSARRTRRAGRGRRA